MIGISSPPFCLRKFEDVLEEVTKAGFKLWEILADAEHSMDIVVPKLEKLAPSYDVRFQLHAPMSDVNVASVNPQIRAASVQELERALKLSSKIGVKTVTVHPGYFGPLTFGDNKTVVRMSATYLKPVVQTARDLGMDIVVENMPNINVAICTTAAETWALADMLGVGTCFDIGHANTTGQMTEFLSKPGIVHNIHAHDNIGKFDEHRTIGDGNIDFKRFAAAFKGYKHNIIIEAQTTDSGVESREKLKKLFPGQD